MKKKLILLILVLASNLFPQNVFAQDNFTKLFLFCQSNNDFNCIEKVDAILPDGSIIPGKDTGKLSFSTLGNPKDEPFGRIIGPQNIISFDTLQFANGNSHANFYIYYWPQGLQFCWNNGNCTNNLEGLNIYARASSLERSRDPIILTGKNALIACGDETKYCNIGSPPWEFNNEVNFELTLRVDANYSPIFTHGRTKNFGIKLISSSDQNFKKFKVNFSPLQLDNVYFAAKNIKEFNQGVYTTDEPAIWIYGKNNDWSKSIGQCGQTGGLSVVSNAFEMGVPKWNDVEKSIEVQLSATHVKTNGQLNSGYLEVRIPKSMAVCMWGIKLDGSVSAKVGLTYGESGVPEVMTVTGKPIGEDFLFISAGFHYSNPKVSFRLSNSDLKKVSEKICKKGKKTIKIKSNKKCPSGYK